MALVGADELRAFQEMEAVAVVMRLSDHAKQDPSFIPVKNKHTTRWHITVRGHEFELLLNGPKFFDTRQKCGGGGAIDLTMHLMQIDFKRAVQTLRSLSL